MADSTKTWKLIHSERVAVADTLEDLAPEQWTRPSLCAGWTVRLAAAHILAGAEQTPTRFLTGMASTGFRFNVLMVRNAHTLGSLEPGQIVDRLRRRTTTTNHPPAPVMAMLGEIVVHGEDIRRPLGRLGAVSEQAALACLEMFKGHASRLPARSGSTVCGLSRPMFLGLTVPAARCRVRQCRCCSR